MPVVGKLSLGCWGTCESVHKGIDGRKLGSNSTRANLGWSMGALVRGLQIFTHVG